MPDLVLLVVILAAILIGYFFGRRDQRLKGVDRGQSLSRDYFVGLNYLLNEQTDEAIETFIKALDINNDTVDTYLALGSLFCKRGEVDKSIRVHQDLLARPSLTSNQSIRVQLALARDYLSAGLLDRAETILSDLGRQNSEYRQEALIQLLKVYEQEKEWFMAAEVAEKLLQIKNEKFSINLAHYYCEQGDLCLRNNDHLAARKFVRKAFTKDKNSVRASLLLGQMELAEGSYKECIKVLQKISRQNMKFVSLAIPMLEMAYERLGSVRGLTSFLSYCLKEDPGSALLLAMTRIRLQGEGESSAIEFLTSQLNRHPTLKGLSVLIDLQLRDSTQGSQTSLVLIRKHIARILEFKPVYECGKCGFSGKKMHWRCPGCHSWETISPIQGIEGE